MSMDGRTVVAISLIVLVAGVGGGFVLASSLTPAKETPSKLVIAIQPTEAASEIAPRAKQLEEFLEARVGVDVEIYVPTSYAAVVEAIRFGNADVAFMSAWPSYLANRLAGAEVLLAEVREVTIDLEKRNEPFYFSYWVVPKNSPVSSLDELRGAKACFPSPISTSGYVFPVAKMVELGLIPRPGNGEADPRAFFGEVVYAGGYGQCWASLKAEQVDVSIIAGDVSEKLYNEVRANTKVLQEQGPVPSHAVVFGPGLREPMKSKLIDALLESDDTALRDTMRKLVSGIFVSFKATTTAEHIAGLQKALELTNLKFTERL